MVLSIPGPRPRDKVLGRAGYLTQLLVVLLRPTRRCLYQLNHLIMLGLGILIVQRALPDEALQEVAGQPKAGCGKRPGVRWQFRSTWLSRQLLPPSISFLSANLPLWMLLPILQRHQALFLCGRWQWLHRIRRNKSSIRSGRMHTLMGAGEGRHPIVTAACVVGGQKCS